MKPPATGAKPDGQARLGNGFSSRAGLIRLRCGASQSKALLGSLLIVLNIVTKASMFQITLPAY